MTPLLAQRTRPDRSFERIYKRHVGDVYRYALAVMRNAADAEDVTQTTFLNAYRAYVEKGSRPEKPQNWLIAIAHNVCRQRFRQSARRPAEVTYDDDIADVIADDEAPTGEDIRRALSQLAFNQRAALVMRELEGRSYAEIAEILELSTGAVETLIFRARRALREQLEGSLTCGEAEFAISRQLDGRLSREEKGQLRAHLRECPECARFARRQRAQRSAFKSLGLIPVPASLGSLFGGGSTAVTAGGAAMGTGLAVKTAAAVTATLVIGVGGYEGLRDAPWKSEHAPAAKPKPIQSELKVAPVAATRGSSTFEQQARGPFQGGNSGHVKTHAAKAGTHGQGKKAERASVGKSHKLVSSGRAHKQKQHTGVAVGHSKPRPMPVRAHAPHPVRTHAKAKSKPQSKPKPSKATPPAGKKAK
jgi:RNA polymerase sigma-70 factor (ECF subfamily)